VIRIGDVRPDLYLVLDLPVARGRERQAAQGKAPDRLERAEDAFHQRVAEAFRREQGPEVVHLDAAADAAALHQAVWRVVVERFPRLQ
jgi:dTMP kinase